MSTDDDSTTPYTDGRVSSLTDFERHATIVHTHNLRPAANS